MKLITEEIKHDAPEHSRETGALPPMFWAAAGASTIPVIIGFIGLYLGFVPTQIGRSFYQDFLFTIPTSLCFAFGAPLVAWLSCQDLIYRTNLENRNHIKLLGVGPVAVKYSFYVHGLAFLAHVILISIFMDGNGLDLFILSFMLGGLINGVLFVIITMPLSALCAAIFVMLYRPLNALPST